MTITTRVKNEEATISLGASFDFESVQAFRDAYNENPADKYTVDFRITEYMDSSGLGMLLNMRRHLDVAQQCITLINCRPQIKRVFHISHLEKIFSIS